MQEPLMPDRKADICSIIRARTMLGPATPPAVSSISIIDGMDMARYHCILDRRVAFNEGEIGWLSPPKKQTRGGGLPWPTRRAT